MRVSCVTTEPPRKGNLVNRVTQGTATGLVLLAKYIHALSYSYICTVLRIFFYLKINRVNLENMSTANISRHDSELKHSLYNNGNTQVSW